MRAAVLAVLVIALLMTAFVGMLLWQRDKKRIDAENAKIAEANRVGQGGGIQTNAEGLVRAFAENRVAADRQFTGQVVVVVGLVQGVKSERYEGKDIPYVVLDGGAGSVIAAFTGPWPDEIDAIAVLRPGNALAVRCVVSSYDGDVYMRTCTTRP